MRYLLITACSLLLLAVPSLADSQAAFTRLLDDIERSLIEESRLLSSGGGLSVRWLDEERFLYLPDSGRYTLDLVNTRSNSQTRLAEHEEVKRALAFHSNDPENCALLGLSADDEVEFHCGDDVLRIDVKRQAKQRVERLEDAGKKHHQRTAQVISDQFPTTFGPLVESLSPDGRSVVTVRDHNLYLRSTGDGTVRALTRDGTLRETWLNTQESAQRFSAFWSHDSRTIATMQLDTREVWHEPLPQLLENPPRTEPVAYPRAGEPMHRFRVFLIDVATGERVVVQTGDTRDHYVDIIGWQGDDQGLLYQVLDREHKRRQVYRADRKTGRVERLLDDITETYHDSWMTLFVDFVVPLERTNGFLYLSENSGWRHIVRHDGEGGKGLALTSGEWAVERIVHVDERSGFIYFLAALDAERPFGLQLYRASLSQRTQPHLVSGGAGRVEVEVSPAGDLFVVRYSSPDLPPVVELRRGNGELVRQLSRFNDTALQESGFGGMETVAVRTAGQRWSSQVTVIRPYDFDEKQSYPVIEHIYGGMQASHARHQYYGFGRAGRVDDVTRALLRAGYVVVRVDVAGTPGRGRAYQDAVYGTWPQGVIAEHAAAIREVSKGRPWMDLTRVGVFGHSWGSYMAQRALIDAPAFYLAAAAHNGGSDFYDQPTYIEPFMGLPKSNPEGYAAASNLDRVDRINGALLSFTAPFDVNSGFSPAFKLVDAMVAARKDIELVVTPRSNHRMQCCGDPETLFKLGKLLRFFEREVKTIER